jgi:hypothetical protein
MGYRPSREVPDAADPAVGLAHHRYRCVRAAAGVDRDRNGGVLAYPAVRRIEHCEQANRNQCQNTPPAQKPTGAHGGAGPASGEVGSESVWPSRS